MAAAVLLLAQRANAPTRQAEGVSPQHLRDRGSRACAKSCAKCEGAGAQSRTALARRRPRPRGVLPEGTPALPNRSHYSVALPTKRDTEYSDQHTALPAHL